MNRIIKVGIGFLLLFLIVTFIAQVDFELMIDKLIQLNWRFLIIALVPGLGYFLATLAWRYCLPDQQNPPKLFQLFMIRHVGESLALINPTNIIAGESSKAVLLKRLGITYQDGIVSLVLSRTLLILSHVFLLILVSLSVYYAMDDAHSFPFQIVLLGLSLLLGLSVFYALTNHQLWLYRLFHQFTKKTKYLQTFDKQIKTINLEMIRFYQQRRQQLLKVFFLSALHWGVGALEFYLIFWFLDFPISYENALFIELGVMIFKSLGSFIPGQIGIEEYGNLFMLSLLSYENTALWLAISLIRRGRQVVWLIVGIVMASLLYHKVRPQRILASNSV